MPGIRVKNGPSQGQTFTIGDKPLTLGRDDACDVPLQDKGSSRQHAEIFRIGDMCFVRDLESKNGTFVNDNRVTEEMLRDGDRIQIGGTVMVFEPLAGRADDDLDFSEDELEGFYELRLEDLTSANVGEGDVSSERHLRALYRLSRLVSSEESENELVDKALAFIAETLRADGAYLFGRDPQSGNIVTLGSHTPKGRTGQLSRTIIRKVMQDKRALLVTDAMRDDRFSANESVMRHNIHAVLCAPLALYGNAESVLYIAGDDPAISFNEQELELVAAMADQMGLALSHIGSKLRRREYLFSAVRMLLRAADAHRPGILTENERLAGFARAIGQTMGMKPDGLEKLQLGALLHNYGEMVSTEPAKDVEALLGETVDLLSNEPFFADIEPLVAYQLENYNGSGPKKLHGQEIPLEARIFQIAKLLLNETRGSSNPDSLKQVIVFMKKQGPSGYDPEVMEAMLKAYDDGLLGLSLEEQWRKLRSSRMSAFIDE